ncbi:Conserved hypothetical protein 2001 [hydrothermal vent metagenome]|uniref:Uncharacterized protein n=1 Tax=hydrothermal vent metagenome TaxID=652676 RepID=A0A1W1EHU8_9ZZZZ
MRKLGLSLVVATSIAFAGGIVEEEPKVVYTPPPVEKSDIEISANMTLASKYIWRGQDQNNKGIAIQGGIDLSYKGFYIGTWASNVDFDTATKTSSIEIDIYGGYKGEVAGIGFDIGAIAYFFPNTYVDMDNTMTEIYLGVSKEIGNFSVGATYSYAMMSANPAIDETYNLQFDASVKTVGDITLAGSYGMIDGADDYYYAISASKTVGKFDLALTYTGVEWDNPLATDEDHIVASISTSF